jgi:tRNA (guanine37-N1)-methyltransferase
VLTGGELPAMVIIDAVARMLPGVLGNPDSAIEESFSEGRLEYPPFTRPREYRGWPVPDVLLSGHHGNIRKWRQEKGEQLTRKVRPDLLEDVHHDDEVP